MVCKLVRALLASEADMIKAIETAMRSSLGGYGVGPAIGQPGFCSMAALESAGLEGALLMARGAIGRVSSRFGNLT